MPYQSSLEELKPQGSPSSLSSTAIVSSCALAGRSAFIYAILDKGIGLAYIGQTRNSGGALGRLSQHLSWDTNSNTYRQRVLRVLGLDYIELENVEMIGVPLPDDDVFQSEARDYREAVESLVYDYVLDSLTSNGRKYGLVSHAYRHPYRTDKAVISASKRIGQEIVSWLNK